jgi:glycosyltransferase involved in cell wall biosynthesis
VSITLLSQATVDAPTVSSAVARVGLSGSRLFLAVGIPIWRGLRSVSKSIKPALIHSHGVWHPANHWVSQAARAWGVPLIIHPRGMLEPWALEQKPLKKRLALALFQRRDLESARAFVATSEMEYEGLRQFGLRQPVAVIPNGVDLDEADAVEPRAARRQDRERVALFLSRVHPKKGVLELVQAWGQVAPSGWRLRIAGPDEGGHWGQVERLVRQLGLGDRVEYLGPVEGERKAALYREADLFVLPTFSENFGVVVAEALAHGLPVITTRGAPWADLETYGCGWWIEVGVDPLVVALQEAMALTDEQRAAMGARGREYVRRFDWGRIAEQTVELYRWILGQGEMPDVVRLD